MVVAPLVFFGLYNLSKKENIKQMFSIQGFYYILAFSIIAIASPIIFGNINGLLGGIFCFFLFILAVRSRIIMDKKLFDNIMKISVVLSIGSFVIALIQKCIFEFAIVEQHIYRSKSTFFNTNYYAFIIDIVILICVYKIATRSKYKLFYYGVIFINLSGLILSLNRSSYLAVLLGIMIFLFFTEKKTYAYTMFIIIVIVLVSTYICPSIIPRFASFKGNSNTRFEIFNTAINGIRHNSLFANLFGRGLWGYQQIVSSFGGKFALTAHSILLDPLVSFGFVGTACLIGYFVTQIKALIYNAKNKALVYQRALVVALLVTTVVHNVADLPIIGIQTPIMLLILMSISGVEYKKRA